MGNANATSTTKVVFLYSKEAGAEEFSKYYIVVTPPPPPPHISAGKTR